MYTYILISLSQALSYFESMYPSLWASKKTLTSGAYIEQLKRKYAERALRDVYKYSNIYIY